MKVITEKYLQKLKQQIHTEKNQKLWAIQILHVFCKELPTAFTQTIPSLPCCSSCFFPRWHQISRSPLAPPASPAGLTGPPSLLEVREGYRAPDSVCLGQKRCVQENILLPLPTSLPQTPRSSIPLALPLAPGDFVVSYRSPASLPEQYLQTEIFFKDSLVVKQTLHKCRVMWFDHRVEPADQFNAATGLLSTC